MRFRNLLSEFARDRIVLISTHIVPDVEYIASRNMIMKNGRLIADGSTDELVKLANGRVWSISIDTSSLSKLEGSLDIVNIRNEDGGSISIRYLSDKPEIEGSKAQQPRLEDLYLMLFPTEGADREAV